ncbi:hypothetical protein T190_30615 [Sinorhizobium meliloti CCBAU 01290]|nr:hypothetical protein T190_30615 [Sinorhizobium meliloti CCBAU 01290]
MDITTLLIIVLIVLRSGVAGTAEVAGIDHESKSELVHQAPGISSREV